MYKRILIATAAVLSFSGAANASLISLTNVAMQQTGPAATPGQRFASVSGSGTWTWDNVTNTITQSGSNTFVFGPSLPSSVAYTLTISGMVITGAGATSASGYSCADGNFAASIAASICGGYDFYPPSYVGNFTNDSTLVINATTCTRTIGGNDYITGPTICLSNAFNGTNAMSVRDTTVAGLLKVRPSNFILTAPWGNGAPNYATTQPYGAPGSGWELQFTTTAVPLPAAGWLLGSAVVSLVGVARRKVGFVRRGMV